MARRFSKVRIHPLSQLVQDFREQFGLTQDDLAALLNKTRSYVSAMESGKRAVTSSVLVALHEYGENIKEKIALASATGLTISNANIGDERPELAKKWNKRLDIIRHKIRTINDRSATNHDTKSQHERAHALLGSFVHVLDNDVAGNVFRHSHHKKTKQLQNVPTKDLHDQLVLECLRSEATIIHKYLSTYFDAPEEIE